MIHHDLLVLAINEKYPDLVHGQDFMVAHPLDPETGKQSGDAFIAKWAAEGPPPPVAPLLERAEQLRPVLTGMRARAQRDTLLSQCDWTMMPDAPVENREAWRAYRAALRDIPTQPGFPLDIEWPTAPK